MQFFRKKTPTEFKRWHWLVLAIVIASSLFFRWYNNRWTNTMIKINNRDFKVLVANTPRQQYEGWSNKDTMGGYDGMLFVFGFKDYHTFVMRQMRFALDIVWLDNGVIVDMAPNLPPDPATKEVSLIPYRPRLPATAVLEMPAGFIAAQGLKIGDKVIVE